MVNYAEQYSKVIDEKFANASVTEALINRSYSWDGTQTIQVYGVDTPTLNNYNSTGTNRFGSPEELGNTKKAYTLTQDKAFTFTIDRRSNADTNFVMEAGSALERTIREVVIPEIDKYRLSKVVAGAGTTSEATPLTKSNAYEQVLKAQEALGEKNVPLQGRVLYVTYAVYNLLKQDSNFVKAGDISQDLLIKGSLGMVDGLNIIPVPSALLPENVAFVFKSVL